MVLSDCWRLISFSLKTSSTALARSSELARSRSLFAGPPDRGPGALEVEALGDFAGRLVQGVVHLLAVHLGDDVERRFGQLVVPPSDLIPRRCCAILGCAAGPH